MIIGGESAAAIAVDWWVTSDVLVQGFLGDEEDDPSPVVAFPADAAWLILRRDCVESQTREQYLRSVHEDTEATRALSKELDPEGLAQERSFQPMIVMARGQEPEFTTPEPATDYRPGNYV